MELVNVLLGEEIRSAIRLNKSSRLLSRHVLFKEPTMTTITKLSARDIRFPTSRSLDGSDAMNAAPDYSATYAILETDSPDGLTGHGLTFTIGRGNEVCVAALNALAPLVVGKRLEDIAADMGGFWRAITSDSQLRWLGPDKGVIHLATAAVSLT
jgi:L-fuconate dehydratase